MRGCIVIVLLALLVSMTTRAAEVGAPDFAALRAAGLATAAKLRAGPAAAWRVTGVTAANVTMAADVLDSPDCRRIIFSAQTRAVPAKLVPVGTLFETPRAWYYTDIDGRHRKHRPHEVVLPLMMTAMLRELASLSLITDDNPAALGQFVARRGDVARYAVPAPDGARTDVVNGPRFIKDGPSVAVDVRTGIVTEFTMNHAVFTVTGFHHLPALLRDELNPAIQTWEDFTDDPTAKARPDNLVMLGHAPFWRAGDPMPEPAAVLFDLATGRFRRVPFAGVQALPGCFVKDRSAVIVAGMDAHHDGSSLYRVDLKTGANRRLGGAGALPRGHIRMPVLSPDGTSIAFLHRPDGTPIPDSQVVVVDLATDVVRKVGQPVHGAFLSWLPDGTGFVLLMRPGANRKAEDPGRICRMDLDGKVTPLCDGGCPIVLPSRKAIAFETPEHAWQLCDLDGSSPRPLNTGGAQFSCASPSPDDNRLLMLGDGKNGPAPAVYDLSTQTHRFLDLPKGLWAIPAWR